MNKNYEHKKRTHQLIELGGLVRVSGLDKLDKGELLGLLIHMNYVHQKLPNVDRQDLRDTGWNVLKKRKMERKNRKEDVPLKEE
jgi:hypothetical protein